MAEARRLYGLAAAQETRPRSTPWNSLQTLRRTLLAEEEAETAGKKAKSKSARKGKGE